MFLQYKTLSDYTNVLYIRKTFKSIHKYDMCIMKSLSASESNKNCNFRSFLSLYILCYLQALRSLVKY